MRRKWVWGGIIMETLCTNYEFKYFGMITFFTVFLFFSCMYFLTKKPSSCGKRVVRKFALFSRNKI